MLVVTRKQNQSVVFPTLGIRVEILRIAGKAVRVGVKAPDEIRILRGELDAGSAPSARADGDASREVHQLRNRLNKANLALKLLQKQLDAGKIVDAEESLAVALETFDAMEESVANQDPSLGISFPQTSVPESNSPRKHALLVEDDPNERALLASYLRASGYDVDTVEDGQAALDYLVDHKPDAVVMDMQMPRLDGRECVSRIRQDDRFDETKLFVVSGTEQGAMQIPIGDRGVQRWFQKPLCPEDLVEEFQASLN